MLRSEAITIIKRGLGFRQTQDAAIVAALKQVQRDLEGGKTLPDWLLEFDAEMTVTADTATVALPTGFLRFHEEYEPYYLDSEGEPVTLPRKRAQEAEDAYAGSDETYPQVFVYLSPTLIKLVPTPTTSFTLYLTYYKAADLLDSDVENAWLAHAANYLIGMAGMMVAADLRDKGAADKFNAMAKLGGQTYLGEIIESELAGRPLILGRDN